MNYADASRFRPCPAGSREGRIVVVQLDTDGADENGGRFTVKKYHSKKTVTTDSWRHDRIKLLPVNPAFEPIEIEPEDGADRVIAGEYVCRVSALPLSNRGAGGQRRCPVKGKRDRKCRTVYMTTWSTSP